MSASAPRRAVLLDLDNTLVHTTPGERAHPGYDAFPYDRSAVVHVRPYARAFLAHLMKASETYEFGFWTCGTRDYARYVVNGLLELVGAPDWPVRILLTRDDATICDAAYVKDLDLAKRRFDLTHVVLLDDNPVHLCVPSNVPGVCLVPPFAVTDPDARNDHFLLDLLHHLFSMPRVHRPRAVRPPPRVADAGEARGAPEV